MCLFSNNAINHLRLKPIYPFPSIQRKDEDVPSKFLVCYLFKEFWREFKPCKLTRTQYYHFVVHKNC